MKIALLDCNCVSRLRVDNALSQLFGYGKDTRRVIISETEKHGSAVCFEGSVVDCHWYKDAMLKLCIPTKLLS